MKNGLTKDEITSIENAIKAMQKILNGGIFSEEKEKICPICGNTGEVMLEDYTTHKCKRCYPDG